MAKEQKKKRSDKYESKVSIFGTLDAVLKASVSEKKDKEEAKDEKK
ncbi:hypothetical protein [uncultured Arcticibacterium sp.]